jgi:hypothetical protein
MTFHNGLVDNIDSVLSVFEECCVPDPTSDFVIAEQLLAIQSLVESLCVARHVVSKVASRVVVLIMRQLVNKNREIRLQVWLLVPKLFSWWLGDSRPPLEWIHAAEAVLRTPPECDEQVRIAQGIAAAHLISSLQM